MFGDLSKIRKKNIQALGSIWGAAFGILCSLVMGKILNECALCMAIGPGFGMALGAALSSLTKKNSKPGRTSDCSIRQGILWGSSFLMLLVIVSGLILLT